MITKVPGVLEIDHDRGVIYFHLDPAEATARGLATALRIGTLPTPIPPVQENMLDIGVSRVPLGLESPRPLGLGGGYRLIVPWMPRHA